MKFYPNRYARRLYKYISVKEMRKANRKRKYEHQKFIKKIDKNPTTGYAIQEDNQRRENSRKGGCLVFLVLVLIIGSIAVYSHKRVGNSHSNKTYVSNLGDSSNLNNSSPNMLYDPSTGTWKKSK